MRAAQASVAVALVAATLGGCATPSRLPATAGMQAVAVVPGYTEPIRFWADASPAAWLNWRQRWLADRPAEGDQSFEMLAISSGSDKGAFAAGYLNGWSARGSRPTFALVTGVSTGALIAPFAFLGSDEDATLRALYTGIEANDIFRRTPVRGALGGPSFASTQPLRRLIARHVTADIVDRIAVQHRAGRRLLVLTTNLDAQRGVVWDVGEIAASRAADKVELIRSILLASASIPGVFPPVEVAVHSGAEPFTEMHVDGGTTSSVFVVPDALLSAGAGADVPGVRRPGMTLLYNGVLAPRYMTVAPSAFSIIERALETVIGASDRRAIGSYRAFAEGSNVSLCIEAIDPTFDSAPHELFDRQYMMRLFDWGHAAGRTHACQSGLHEPNN